VVRDFFIIKGYVQGVGFRYFVSYTAKLYDLTGWIKNCDDGSVQMEAQGKKDSLEEFINKIKIGNGFCEIEDIFINEIKPVKNERNFKIIY
jgi:acylphosphatase